MHGYFPIYDSNCGGWIEEKQKLLKTQRGCYGVDVGDAVGETRIIFTKGFGSFSIKFANVPEVEVNGFV
jgi:hypothetical protein